jgi:ParB family chromosome partitioning protein
MNAQTARDTHETDEETLAFLPLDRIEVIPGFNTRTFIDPDELQKLAEEIKSDGVIQAILVRPHPAKDSFYAIIAGERRYRAILLAGLTQIPAMIRHVTDSQALILNAIENLGRENLSAADEAGCVRRVVEQCGGDRDEAARQLGMSRRVVDARLLLLNASEKVRDALKRKTIKLGHAELLAMLPEKVQDATLDRVIETKATVEELRSKLGAYALNLSSAIFDTSECRGCKFNSSRQASLFDTHVGDGRCGNHECYEQKRQNKIRALKSEQESAFNVVHLDSDRTETSFTLLVKTGAQGVGREQYAACLSCANFGALMSARPGEEGRLTTDVCFDLNCHKVKVAAYQATLRPAAPSSAENGMAETSAQDPPAKSTSGNAKAKTHNKATTAATPRRVEDLIHKFYRETASVAIKDNPRMGLVYAAYALLNDISTEASVLLKQHGLSSRQFGHGNLHKGIEALSTLDNEILKALVVDAAATLIKGKLENSYGSKDTPDIVKTAMNTLKLCQTDLTKHFCVDRGFLEAHTKAGIESLMIECGFDKWYAEKKNDPKAFHKLMAEKNDKIIKDILSSGFDFKGFVPKQVALSKSC